MSSLLSFKDKTRSAVSESKQGLGYLIKTAKALPRTIRISSRQVPHSTDDEDGGSLYDIKGRGYIPKVFAFENPYSLNPLTPTD